MKAEAVTIELPEPSYTLLRTESEGLPAIIVVNEALLPFEHRDIFPWYLSVVLQPRELAERGMPTGPENKVLNILEDEITAAVLKGFNALFVARITWNGKRRILFQVHDGDRAEHELQALVARPVTLREWSYQLEAQDRWEDSEVMLQLLKDAKQRGANA